MLRVPCVVSLVAVLGAACGGSGDNDGPESAGDGAVLRLEYLDPSRSQYLPGELVHVRIVAGGVAELPFGGTLTGTDVPLVVDESATELTLLVVVPPVASGDHRLQITQNAARGELPLWVATYEPIADPASYVASAFGELDSELAALLADETAADGRAYLEDKRNALAAGVEQVAMMSSAEQAQVAYLVREVKAREVDGDSWRWGLFPECPPAENLVTSVQAAALGAGVTAFAGAWSFVNPIAIPVATQGRSLLAKGWASALRSVDRILDECLDFERILDSGASLTVAGKSPTPSSSLATSAASAPPLVFQHGVPKFVSLSSEYSLDPELVMALDNAKSKLDEHASGIPPSWLSGFGEYHGPIGRGGPPDDLVFSVVNFMCGTYNEVIPEPNGITATLRFIHALQCPSSSGRFHLYLGTPDRPTAYLREGVLEPVCEAPLSVCNNDWNACYDLQNDENHCGSCESSCMTGDFRHPDCIQGTCSCANRPGTIMCTTGFYAGNCMEPEQCM